MAYEVGVVADLDTRKWDQSVRDWEREVDGMEAAMDALSQTFNDVERAANQVDLDVKPTVDDSELKQANDVINDVRDDLARLDGATASPDIEPTGETETRNQLEDIKGKLDEIALFQRFEFTWNFLTNLDQIVEQLEQIPGLGSLMQLEQAGAAFAAQTGQDQDAVEGLITSLYTGENAIIATREEIAQMAAATYQATGNFENLENDVLAVNNVAEAFGQDFNEVLATANQLVQSGLAANFTEASDIIAAGFQSGANRGGDMLDVLNEYATTFAQMGYTGGQAIGAINAGLNAGTGNADRAADAIREFGIRAGAVGETASGFTQEFEDAARAAGVLDEAVAFREGNLSGAEFLTAASEGLSTIANEADRAAAATALFGTQAEDLGSGVVTEIGVGADDFDNIEGRAQESADTIHDTLTRTLQEFSQEIDQAFVDILDAANVDDWINEARGKLQTFLDELRGGRSLPEALQIALEAPGLVEAMQRFESVAGNLVIGFLQVSETVLRATGQGSAADLLATQIDRLSATQLTFDLETSQLADDANAAISAAFERGVSFEEIESGIQEAYTNAIESGNIDAARAIADAASEHTFISDTGQRQNVILDTSQIETAAQEAQDAFDAAILAGDFGNAQLIADNLGTDLRTELARAVEEQDFGLAAILAQQLGGANGVELQSVVAEALAAGLSEEQITEILGNAQGVVDGTITMGEEVATAGDDVTVALDDAALSFEEMEQVVTERSTIAGQSYGAFTSVVITESANAEGALQRLMNKFTDAQLLMSGGVPTGGAPVDDGDDGRGYAAGGVGHGTFMVHQDEMISTNTPLAVLNAETTDSILSGLATLFAGGFSEGTANVTNYNSVTVNVVNNGAAAGAASGNRISDMVRGFN